MAVSLTPFQYQGSKRKLAPLILPYIPRKSRVVELFAGSGAVSIACALRESESTFLLNDLNLPLMGIWEWILRDAKSLSDRYAELWDSQQSDPLQRFNEIRDDFNRSNDPALLLFLLARIVKGAVRYNSKGEFNQSPDKRRLGTKPGSVRKQLLQIQGLMQGRTEIMTADFREVLEFAVPEDVVYMDPPYQGVSGSRDGRYLAGLSYDDFCDALERHIARGIRMVISYDGSTGGRSYGSELPRDFGFHRLLLDGGTSTSSTLHGNPERTVESLYVSKSLLPEILPEQLTLVS